MPSRGDESGVLVMHPVEDTHVWSTGVHSNTQRNDIPVPERMAFQFSGATSVLRMCLSLNEWTEYNTEHTRDDIFKCDRQIP